MAGSGRQLTLQDMTEHLSEDSGSEETAAAWVTYFERQKKRAALDRLLLNYPNYAALIRIFCGEQDEDDEPLSLILAHRFFQSADLSPEELPQDIQVIMHR